MLSIEKIESKLRNAYCQDLFVPISIGLLQGCFSIEPKATTEYQNDQIKDEIMQRGLVAVKWMKMELVSSDFVAGKSASIPPDGQLATENAEFQETRKPEKEVIFVRVWPRSGVSHLVQGSIHGTGIHNSSYNPYHTYKELKDKYTIEQSSDLLQLSPWIYNKLESKNQSVRFDRPLILASTNSPETISSKSWANNHPSKRAEWLIRDIENGKYCLI